MSGYPLLSIRNGKIWDVSANNVTTTGAITCNGGAQTGTFYSNNVSAFRIPADTSANRPTTNYAGYIRYNTDAYSVEYWNTQSNSWQAISIPLPSISSISPQYILQKNTSITYTIIGTNFSTFSNVYFIGNVDLIIYPTASTTFVTSTQITTLITNAIADASINTLFAVKVVNSDTGASSTTSNLVSYNKGPVWNTTIGSSLGTGITLSVYTTSNTPFSDLSASDPTTPPDNPIKYYYSAGGAPATGGTGSVLLDATLGRLYGTMPILTSSTLYNFTAYSQDNAGANGSNASFNFTVSPKLLIYSSGQSLPSPTTDTSYSTYIFPWVSGNQTTYSFTSNFYGSVEYLCVAGGGGGANGNGAGGGGGQVLIGTYDISSNNIIYTINVGNGGAAYNSAAVENRANNGYNSSITGTGLSISALGGGGGVSFSNNNFAGNYGGNGGGGGGRDATTSSFINVGGAFASGGYNVSYSGGSGSSNNTYNAGGGGGGAGGNGSAAIVSGNIGGAGGAGVSSSLSGTSLFYGGGGGGGAGGNPAAASAGGAGGSGIGGTGGSSSSTSGTAGTAGRGAGGGGGGQLSAGAGSNGVVILRFPIEARLFFKNSGYLGACNTNAAVSFNVSALSTVYGLTPQPTITYSVSSGILPSNLTLNASTGIISGTTNVNNNTTIYTFTIQASASGYTTVSQSFTIVSYFYLNSSLLLGFNNNTTNSGTAATTWSATGSNLTYSSSIFRYGGFSGVFNGNNAKVTITTASAPGNNAAFAISLWLNMTSYNSVGRTYIIDLRSAGTDTAGYWLIDSTNTMTFTYSTSGTSAQTEIQIPFIPSFGQWEHLVWVTKDTTTSYPTLYRNGKIFYQNSAITTGTSWTDTTSTIGTYSQATPGSGNNYWLTGYIDNLMIYRGTLSSSQVQAIYENTITY